MVNLFGRNLSGSMNLKQGCKLLAVAKHAMVVAEALPT